MTGGVRLSGGCGGDDRDSDKLFRGLDIRHDQIFRRFYPRPPTLTSKDFAPRSFKRNYVNDFDVDAPPPKSVIV